MTMTREEMQRLASLGRGGDTMLAHINPEEAALLKSRGGSGTINPNTGLPEFRIGGKLTGGVKSVASIPASVVNNPVASVKSVAEPIVAPVEKAAGQVTSNLANLPSSVESAVQQVAKPVVNFLKTPEGQIALALALPSMGSAITTAFPAISAPVATAMASTAVQVAQGVPFETALQNATVNAVTSTGSPAVAKEINDIVKIPQISDAITSAGASALKTGLAGGTQADIQKNILGALTGSGVASAVEAYTQDTAKGRLAGSAAGGAVVGGTTGAVSGLAGEYASQKAASDDALERAKKGIASVDTGAASDVGNQLGEVVVTAQKEPTLQDTTIISPDVSIKKGSTPSLAPVTVTAKKDTTQPSIQDTTIISPETETETAPEPGKPPVDEQGVYKPNLFIYGGKGPKSTLGVSLGTQAPFYPVAGTTGGLTSTRGAGEIESKETGKARKNVWNEASLRLKDALGV